MRIRNRVCSSILMSFVVIAHAASASAQTSSKDSEAKFATEVPLLECGGTPCVEAKIGNGRTLKMVIDTGNVDSVLETALAKDAGLRPAGKLPAGAPAEMFRTVIPSITVGGVSLENVPAMAMVLGDMISQNQMPAVDGTLAYTAFKDRIVQLDFAAHKLRISGVLTAAAKCAGRCDKISLIKFGNDGPPIVVANGFEINGHAISAQVDTMFTGALLVYSASIEKLQLADAAKTTKTRDFPLTDGGVTMKEATADKEGFHGKSFGPRIPLVYFPTPDVHEPDGLFDATVGVEMFYNAVLTLDFRDMTIEIATP